MQRTHNIIPSSAGKNYFEFFLTRTHGGNKQCTSDDSEIETAIL